MNACTTCGHGLAGDRALWTTCQACHERIDGQLAEAEQLWEALPAHLEPGAAGSGPRVSGSRPQTLPAEKVINLVGPGGVHDRLYVQYANIAVTRGYQPCPRAAGGTGAVLAQALRGIRRHLPWAVQGMNLTGLSDELRSLVGELRAATGETAARHTELALACPAVYGDGTACGGTLRYHRDKRGVSCTDCGTVHDPATLLSFAGAA